jgi:WD40 repeat protein
MDTFWQRTLDLCLENPSRRPLAALCNVAAVSKRFLIMAERTAERACRAKGRKRVNDRAWRRILAHLGTLPQCEQILPAGEGDVTCVASLGDGHFVSGSRDASLRVWDSAKGKITQTKVIEGHPGGAVTCMVHIGDGRVVSGSRDHTLRVWERATRQCALILTGHGGVVYSVCHLGDGRVVSGSEDRSLRLWDTVSGRHLCTLMGHTGAVFCICNLGGGRVASGSQDRAVRVWDIAAGVCRQTMKGHKGEVEVGSDTAWIGEWGIGTVSWC